MSKSFDLMIDGMIEALRSHVLPRNTDDFVRGQLFSIMFSLNGLKLAADWRAEPLRAQLALQDAAFEDVRRLAATLDYPPIPETPRSNPSGAGSAMLEQLRDDGDRLVGELLIWTATEKVRAAAPVVAQQIESLLRNMAREQLKIELAMTPKSMLNQIATGKE